MSRVIRLQEGYRKMPKNAVKSRRRRSKAVRRGNKLIEYQRVSKVGDREDTLISPEVQGNENRGYAGRNGFVIVDTVLDLDKTGTESTERRIRSVIDRIEAGEADGVLVWKVSRWGRNTMDSLLNIAELEAAGGFIVSSQENLDDIVTPAGRFSLTVLLAIAEMFAAEIGKTWENIHSYRRANGKTHGAGPRLGYVQVKDIPQADRASYTIPEGSDYAVDPQTAPWVVNAMKWYVEGLGMGEIVRKFHTAGITTSWGNRMTERSLRVSLDGGFCAGKVVDKREDPWVFHQGIHEALVSEDLWKKYQRRRDEIVAPRIKSAPYRLAGLLVCAGCGSKLSAQKASKKRGGERYFRCPKHGTHQTSDCPRPVSILETRVEAVVLDWLKSNAYGEEALTAAIGRAYKVEEARADVAKIERDIVREEKRLGLLTVKNLDGEITGEAYKLTKEQIEKNILALRAARDSNEIDVEINDMPAMDTFGACVEGWDTLDPAIFNQALRRVVKRVDVIKHPEKHGRAHVRVVGGWEKAVPKPVEAPQAS